LLPARFAQAMAVLGPFETSPHIAVAVSGGRDSMALMRLLAGWSHDRCGHLTALTVDHRLRPESGREADQVAAWAQDMGIDHVTLRWTGPKPHSRLQAAARQARFHLMTDWCREAGILHLALAHQADDQRETVAMRRARLTGDKSAAELGLAGMSAVTIRSGIRVLRPLLGVTRAQLSAYLETTGQSWIDDPSNVAEQYERVRWRLGRLGDLPDVEVIAQAGEKRHRIEGAAADLLMRSCQIDPAGFALIGPACLAAADGGVRDLAVGQVIALIGGGEYRPSRHSLRRDLEGVLDGGPARSLGGCLIGTWRKRLLIAREAASTGDPVRITGPGSYSWDRRFTIQAGALPGPVEIAALGEPGLRELGQIAESAVILKEIPPPARAGLPAARDATGRLIRVPFTEFDPFGLNDVLRMRLLPHNSATSIGFTVA
jgi:tRNA(Ile)-lysidine synthase